MTLAVGPIAVASLMTASALAPLALAGTLECVTLVVLLAYFLSHPVISGFISGSAVLIAIAQLKYLFGIKLASGNVMTTLSGLVQGLPHLNPTTTALGIGALLFLFFARSYLGPLIRSAGLPARAADLATKLAPMVAVIATTTIVGGMGLDQHAAVSIVGAVPAGLPTIAVPQLQWQDIRLLWLPTLLISLVGFVESVSVAQSLALKRSQRIKPNKELLGIGAANLASALSGGYPVTGSFARSVVNFLAGAHTTAAGMISAVMMAAVIAGLSS